MTKNNKNDGMHLMIIPAEIAVHSGVDDLLKNNGVGNVGRGLAQLGLLSLDVFLHIALENA